MARSATAITDELLVHVLSRISIVVGVNVVLMAAHNLVELSVHPALLNREVCKGLK